MNKEDEKTYNELISVLGQHCGQRGDNEGAVETLKRIIRERDRGARIYALDLIAPDDYVSGAVIIAAHSRWELEKIIKKKQEEIANDEEHHAEWYHECKLGKPKLLRLKHGVIFENVISYD